VPRRAAIGAATAAAELVLDSSISALTTGDDRLANAVREEAAVALADVAPEVHARLEALMDAVDANAAVISNYTAMLKPLGERLGADDGRWQARDVHERSRQHA
jgi:hypothetical protein